MNDEKTTRRRFLVATIAGSSAIASGLGLSLIRASSAWAQAAPSQAADSTRTLAQMARVLYPHSALPDSVYAEVVGGILSTTAADPQMIALLEQAVTELGEVRDTDFFDLDFYDVAVFELFSFWKPNPGWRSGGNDISGFKGNHL